MSNAERYARQLLKSVQDMIETATQPLVERYDRLAALVHKLDEITDANHEGAMRTFANHKHAIEQLRAASDTTADVLAAVKAELDSPRRAENGGSGVAHIIRRHGPPPGVPSIDQFTGKPLAPDPTTAALERGNMERAELRKQMEHARTLLSHERKAHEATQAKLEASGRGHAAAMAGIEAIEKTIATMRDQHDEVRQRWRDEQNKATALIDSIALACGVSPLGTRETNTKAVLDWISHASNAATERNTQVERLIDQRVAVENLLADARHSCTEFAQRVRDLEEQARGRDKLAQQRLATFEELQDRIRTVADEKFGPFPVQSADDALSAIEQGIWHDQHEIQGANWLANEVEAWLGNARGRDGIAEAWEKFKSDRTRQRDMRTAAMARFYGPPVPEDDCQAGTCDCPTRPGTYDVAHKDADDYEGSWREAADNEGARIAAESRADAESDPGSGAV